MKRATVILEFVAAILGLLLLVVPAEATCRRVFHAPHVVHNKVVVVEKAVVPVAAVFVPLYSAVHIPGYYPGAVPQAPAYPHAGQAVDPCASLKAEFVQLQQRLLQLERGLGQPLPPGRMPPAENGNGGPGPAPPPQQPDPQRQPGNAAAGFIAWATPRCAACHEAQTARTKGGGFTLLQAGKVAELTPQQAGDVIRRLALPDDHKDAMPKNGKLPPAERMEGVRLFVEGGQ